MNRRLTQAISWRNIRKSSRSLPGWTSIAELCFTDWNTCWPHVAKLTHWNKSYTYIFFVPTSSPLFGTSFYINNQINILRMKKVKTFNQEVEHFGHVLEAEIQKKECWVKMKWPAWSRSVASWRCSVPRPTGCRRSIASSVCWTGKPGRSGWKNCRMWWPVKPWLSTISIKMPSWRAWFFFLMASARWKFFRYWAVIAIDKKFAQSFTHLLES